MESSVLSSCFFHRCEVSNSVGRAPESIVQGVSSDSRGGLAASLVLCRVKIEADALEDSRLGIYIHV